MRNYVKKGLIATAAIAITAAVSVPSMAQMKQPTPEERANHAVDTRQSVFKLLAFNMGPLGGMLRNLTPFDAATAKTNGENIEALGKMIPAVFTMDTREFKVKTEALDRIWGAKATFDGKANDLVMAAQALVKAADSGDEGATKAAMAGVGKACGSCHDDFRQDTK